MAGEAMAALLKTKGLAAMAIAGAAGDEDQSQIEHQHCQDGQYQQDAVEVFHSCGLQVRDSLFFGTVLGVHGRRFRVFCGIAEGHQKQGMDVPRQIERLNEPCFVEIADYAAAESQFRGFHHHMGEDYGTVNLAVVVEFSPLADSLVVVAENDALGRTVDAGGDFVELCYGLCGLCNVNHLGLGIDCGGGYAAGFEYLLHLLLLYGGVGELAD